MTDPFEQQLSDRLHAHPLPDELPDLGLRSVRRGQSIRRRRIASLALVVVILMLVPAGLYSWLRAGAEAPLVGRSTIPPTAEGVPRSVILDPDNLPAGPAPSLGVVRGRTVQLASGRVIELPADQIGSVSQYRSEVAWVAGAGSDLQLNVASRQVPLPAAEKASGVEPGPAGSVMVRTANGPVLFTADEAVVRLTEAHLRTDQMVAGARSLWVYYHHGVVRVDVTDLQAGSFPITDQLYSLAREVHFADPRADLVTVESGLFVEACHAVLSGSTMETVAIWPTCDWTLRAVSPDARFAVGENKQTGSLDVIDLLTDRVVLAIDLGGHPVPEQLVFDEQSRLNMVMQRADKTLVGVICPVSEDCWRSTEPTTSNLTFVLPNRG